MGMVKPELAEGLCELGRTVDGVGFAYTKLSLEGVDLSDDVLEDVGELPHLQVVELKGSNIKDTAPLKQLRGMVHLDLTRNNIAKLPVLANQRFLQVLKLPHNSISSVALIKNHPYLHTLDLSHNSLTSVAGLECASLRKLQLEGNKLTSLDGLKCPELAVISAPNNEIQKVSGRFPALKELDLASNGLKTLKSLKAGADMPVLESLHVENNELPGYTELIFIGKWSHEKEPLPSLTQLFIAGNPWLIEEGFDEGKHPVETLCYLPKLKRLDQLPFKDEENDVPFATPEQLEEATPLREERIEAERLAEEARIAGEKRLAEEKLQREREEAEAAAQAEREAAEAAAAAAEAEAAEAEE